MKDRDASQLPKPNPSWLTLWDFHGRWLRNTIKLQYINILWQHKYVYIYFHHFSIYAYRFPCFIRDRYDLVPYILMTSHSKCKLLSKIKQHMRTFNSVSVFYEFNSMFYLFQVLMSYQFKLCMYIACLFYIVSYFIHYVVIFTIL